MEEKFKCSENSKLAAKANSYLKLLWWLIALSAFYSSAKAITVLLEVPQIKGGFNFFFNTVQGFKNDVNSEFLSYVLLSTSITVITE